MGYNTDLMTQGKKLVENGASLAELRSVEGLQNLSRKTYEQWFEKVRESVPKVDEMLSMINRQFDRIETIAKERGRLDEEETRIKGFLDGLNITERPGSNGR